MNRAQNEEREEEEREADAAPASLVMPSLGSDAVSEPELAVG